MAVQRVIFSVVPIAAEYPIPFPLNRNNYNYSAAIYYEDNGVAGSIPKRPCAIYFHGSNPSTIYPSATSETVKTLTSRGFNLIHFRSFGAGDSTSNPRETDSQYLNVSCPSHAFRAFSTAWDVQAALEFFVAQKATYFTEEQVLLVGHSAGATSIVGWSALSGKQGFYDKSVVRCAFANGFTSGGLGDARWNDPMRVISGLDFALSQVRHPIIMSYGVNDTFAPADMRNRYFYSQRANSNLTFYLQPNEGHSWIEDSGAGAIWGPIVQSLYQNSPIADPLVPDMVLDFTAGALPSAVTFTRASEASSVNDNSLLYFVGNNIPRLEFSAISREPSGFRVENSSTNLVTNNMNLLSGVLSLSTGVTVRSITDPDITNPEGLSPVYKLVEADDVQGDQIQGAQIVVTAAAANTHTVSFYLRPEERKFGYVEIADSTGNNFFRAFFDLYANEIYGTINGGTTSNRNSAISITGNGWYRVQVSAIVSGTQVRGRIRMLPAKISNTLSYIGDGQSGMYVYGPQIEQTSVVAGRGVGATTLIRTTGATATRAVETATLPSKARTSGSFVITHDAPSGVVLLGDTVANHFLSFGTAPSFLFGRVAYTYSPTEVRYSSNGGPVTTLPGVTLENVLYVGGGRANIRANRNIIRIEEYNNGLSDSDLVKVSAP